MYLDATNKEDQMERRIQKALDAFAHGATYKQAVYASGLSYEQVMYIFLNIRKSAHDSLADNRQCSV